ncbi:MAG: OmpA family protein [Clostridia bacterium]|nr:OmpA family protein [Clostridia bacterium]
MKHLKTFKGIVLSILLVCMLVTLTACGGDNGGSTTTTTTGNAYKGTPKISIDEWIGWQSLLDANGGLVTAPDSLNAKRGISVEYVVMNDATTSSSALISGELVGAGYTVNRYAFLQNKFDEAKLEVVMPYITNFSNGGDGIIAEADIMSVEDLVGKKIAVPKFSEAQTLVEWLLNNSSLSDAQRSKIRSDMVLFETPDDAAKAFFSGQVNAAATWEPYLTQAANSTDSRILFDTSMSTNLILDGIVFRKDFVENNGDFVTKLIDAALEASSMYKVEFANIRKLPMFELMSDAEIIDMANGANLATWTQNMQLLSDVAVTMYADMANVWIGLGETAHPAKAKAAFTDVYMANLRGTYEGKDTATSVTNFSQEEKTMLIESPEALLSYNADIKFALNSVEIQQSSYAELDEFVKVAKVLDGVYIQIEGNAAQRADGVSDAQIIDFSENRAQSVANYFMSQGISSERIIIIGNGDMKPLNSENLAAPENRRTEIYFKTKLGY